MFETPSSAYDGHSIAKKATKRAKSVPKTGNPGEQGRRGRSNVSFPGLTFETVLPFAKAIWDHAGASREMKRETLFEILNKAPEAAPAEC